MSDTAATTTNVPKQRSYAHLAAHQVKPGQVLNPRGRPKGARHKLGEAFIEAMHQDFEAHGQEVIQKVRTEKPDQYLKVIASILPKELTVNTTALGDMSDDELTATLAALRDLATTFDAAIARTGAAEAGEAQPVIDVRPVQ